MKIQFLIVPAILLVLIVGTGIYFLTREKPVELSGRWGNELMSFEFHGDGRLTHNRFGEMSKGAWQHLEGQKFKLIYEVQGEMRRDEVDIEIQAENISIIMPAEDGGTREILLAKDHPGPEIGIQAVDTKTAEVMVPILQLDSQIEALKKAGCKKIGMVQKQAI